MKECSVCKSIKMLNCFYARNARCKECCKAAAKARRDANPDARKKYWAANKAREMQTNKQYYAKRKKEDPAFKAVCLLRSRVSKALKARGVRKTCRTLESVGCSPEFFKQYIESKFQSGMTWNNQGLWHIDHIKPLASFDLSKEDEQLKANHYTNLQPLWAEENLKKGNKYVGP